jgi:enamine deaminase RidA (YjgF/YER057c/UK114 family)
VKQVREVEKVRVEERLKELGYRLPEAPPPVGAYVAAQRSGSLLFISGQLPIAGERIYQGRIGLDLSPEEGELAGRICALNALAQAKAYLGTLDRISRVLRIVGYLQCCEGFVDHARVLNGASEFFVQILGERGRHTRVALGVASLPLGAAMELEVLLEVEAE